MGVYDREIRMAQRLIAKKGKSCTWIKNTNTADSNQPWKTTASTPQSYPVKIVFVSPARGLHALVHLMEGTSVPQGGPRALMAQVPFVPAINDSLQVGDETLVIKDFNIVAPNGEVILYKLEFA